MNRPQTVTLAIVALLSFLTTPPLMAQQQAASQASVPVTVQNFTRAETDMYFSNFVKLDALGKFHHKREVAEIDKQDVVRINRDTLYSGAVIDLDAGPVTITLPDTGKRYMAQLIVNEDHYIPASVYAPGRFTYTRKQVGTRYMMALIRTLVDPGDAKDIQAVHALQDKIKIEQASVGKFEVPNWDPVSQKTIRDALNVLAGMEAVPTPPRFGRKADVDPISHLIGTAAGWGGNPAEAARYFPVYPKTNDGKTVHKLTVKDVPVDGFWSLSVYNGKGYFEQNDLNAYSVNNLTAKPNADGSVTVQFGGCQKETLNCLPTPPDWNYLVRLYRPRAEILSGAWQFPEAQPVK
jgi:hypothetical protein